MKNALNLYYTQLMGESLGGALHPLIHVGFAMEFSNPKLLSEGLAYSCISPLKDTSKILNNIDSSHANVETTVLELIIELQGQFPDFQIDDSNFSQKGQFLLEAQETLFKSLIER